MLTFGSLFAGIGGFDLGFERAGMVCKWQVEIDPYARRVLEKHWPDVRRWDDVRTWPQPDTGRVDVICGGFPCQDISSAGKKVGIGGEKSGLWKEFARIIRVLRPRFVVVENVSTLTSRGLGAVLQDLAESGFDAEWETLPAAIFGAPHIRERVFVVGYSNQHGKPSRPEHDEASWMPPLVANAEYAFREQCGTLGRAWRAREPIPWDEHGECTDQALAVRVDDGLPNRMDRLGRLGNAVVPQVAEWVGRRIIESTAAKQHDR